MLCAFVLHLTFALGLCTAYMLENKKREKQLEGKSEVEIEALNRECNIQDFEGISDDQNVSAVVQSTGEG
jgi:hypothetical protein